MTKAAIFETIQKGFGGVTQLEWGAAYYKVLASELSLEAPIPDEGLPLPAFITVCAPPRGLCLKLIPWST